MFSGALVRNKFRKIGRNSKISQWMGTTSKYVECVMVSEFSLAYLQHFCTLPITIVLINPVTVIYSIRQKTVGF